MGDCLSTDKHLARVAHQWAICHLPSAMSYMPSVATWLRKHYAVPAEHGAWAMLLGPFAVGVGLAWQLNEMVLWTLMGVLLFFLARQPMLILAKALSGRRSREDVVPALIWLLIYVTLALPPLFALMTSGRAALFWLVVPALPPLAWQLWLVTRRAERQMTVELAGSGALALAAPAAYFAATGRYDLTALSAWLLCWAQAATAIVYVYLRLEQRHMTSVPERGQQWAMGQRAVLYHAFNFVASVVLAIFDVLPVLTPLAFTVVLAEALRGTFRPAVGVKPQVIGFSQVAATVVFALLLVIAYRVG